MKKKKRTKYKHILVLPDFCFHYWGADISSLNWSQSWRCNLTSWLVRELDSIQGISFDSLLGSSFPLDIDQLLVNLVIRLSPKLWENNQESFEQLSKNFAIPLFSFRHLQLWHFHQSNLSQSSHAWSVSSHNFKPWTQNCSMSLCFIELL